MKPIKLTIRGLNSFNKEQVIDFNDLTRHGLFGVFGPTGSGKSSILDGMTLALYGKTSRDSTNFINTQADRMQISFDFSVNDAIYRVVRSYKRTAQGKINASKPTRIESIKEDENILLEDQTKEVDKKCFEIIGLKFEDFIRTVVLPQGKFSEFIQLKGKERREMLERLFSLTRYGDELSRKLASAIRKEKDQEKLLQGELMGYEAVTDQNLESLKDAYADKKTSYDAAVKETIKNKEVYDQALRVFDLIHKHKDNQEALRTLLVKEEAMVKRKESNLLIRKILNVKPYYKQYYQHQQTLLSYEKDYKIAQEDHKKLSISYNEVHDQFIDLEESYKEFTLTYEVEKIKLEDGIQVNKSRIEKENKVKDNKISLQDIISKKAAVSADNIKLESDLKDLRHKLSKVKKEVDDLSIGSDLQKNVNEGYDLEREVEKNKASVNFYTDKINVLSEKIKNRKDGIKSLKASYKVLNESENMMSEAVYLSELKKLQLIENNRNTSKEQHEKNLVDLSKKEKEFEEIEHNYRVLEKRFERYQKDKEEAYIKSLQENLMDGQACPVCGSKDHTFEISFNTFIEDKNLELEMNEAIIARSLLISEIDKLKKTNGQLLELLETHNKIENQIENLNDSYKRNKECLEEKRRLQQLEENERTLLEVDEGLYKTSMSEQKTLISEMSLQEESLNNLYERVKTNSFKALRQEVYKNLERVESLKTVLDDNEKEILLLNELIDKNKKLIEEYNLKSTLIEQETSNLMTEISLCHDKLKGFESLDHLDLLLIELMKKHESLSDMYHVKLKAIKTIEKDLDQISLQVKKYETLTESTQILVKQSKDEMSSLLTKNQLNMETVSKTEESEESLKASVELVETYELNKRALETLVDDLAIQLKDQDMTEDQLKNLKQEMSVSVEKEKLLLKEMNALEKDINDLKIQMENLKDLLIKKKNLEHKLSLLNDLDYLFRGKKFVEYVASYQLRYISIEASKRLYDITSGKYGLEVDDQGKFLIRDYGHGGMTRDTTTLSGGESFLVSLSLALSLSSQIQLKGTAPLELFFLDEGFGTLDERFLEIVMSSLENIHHKNLSIGLISHVESIKNRVPVKLNVSPSIPGVKGSQVRVEKT